MEIGLLQVLTVYSIDVNINLPDTSTLHKTLSIFAFHIKVLWC